MPASTNAHIYNPADLGITEASQTLNLQEAPIIRERVANVDRPMMTMEQAARYKATQDLIAPIQTQAAPAAPVVDIPAPNYAVGPAAAAPAAPAAPVPAVPATDQGRVSDRIARLFAQKSEAESRNDALSAQLADLTRKFDTLVARETARSNPTQNTFDIGSPVGTSRPDGSISRAELQTLLEENNARLAGSLASQFRTAQEQKDANVAAERDFPEVYTDPAARSVADRIWSSRPDLQRDPNGPYLVAALTRGLLSDPRSATASAVADARKSNLSGVGVSVADGTGTADNRAARYEAAMARARSTQRLPDFVLADLIRQGVA